MSKYEIRIYETLMHTVTVEADDPDSAYEIGYDIVMNGEDGSYDTESCGTADEADVFKVIG